MAASARESIMSVASSLFAQQGYRAIGVDTIIAQSGVAKATLYRHFPSKDDLIAAYLEDVNRLFWEWFEKGVEAYPENPREQLLEVFRRLQKMVTSPTCYGCPFLIAATEFPDPEHPAHKIAVDHKRGLQSRFVDMCQKAGLADPEISASRLLMYMDGAFMAVRLFGMDNPAKTVVSWVERLIACG
ncbi:MAG: TetR/AcrR family transcriptional regulator [Anaerolineae bacterium]|nr:TetR/AcrR family transcriptional regulator [Anaerolineae bacterium]